VSQGGLLPALQRMSVVQEARSTMQAESRVFELGKNRIEALSDGIFAIAMTLLVLELHVPNLPPNAPNVQVAPALWQLWPKLLTYAVSFLSLGVYWIGHHNMYHAIRRADRVLLWLNILFFMCVSLLPFSTSVLNAFRQTQVAPLFFGANLTGIGWLLYLQWAYASAQPEMVAGFVTPMYRALVRSRFVRIPMIATLTMLVCFWSVEILLAVYAMLLPWYMIPGTFERHPAHSPPLRHRLCLDPEELRRRPTQNLHPVLVAEPGNRHDVVDGGGVPRERVIGPEDHVIDPYLGDQVPHGLAREHD
jgi:uncharacterized membrane protein